jgi:hypothetical protein
MGSLKDILNGGLGDLMGDIPKIGGDNGEQNAIIQFTRLDDDDDDEDDEDEDDEDDEDEDDEDDEEEEDDSVTLIKQWGKSSEKSSNSKSLSSSKPAKDSLRQNCIGALRKLAEQGSISPKQKRVLLTDIIKCSAKGEFSMVEVAYELLCGEAEDSEESEEEFADQCRVFAESFETPATRALPSAL